MTAILASSLMSASRENFKVEFTDASAFETFSSPHSFTGMNINGPGLIVAAIDNGLVGTISSVTIGGVAATLGASSTGTNARSSIYYAPVPSGTTATVVVTGTSIARLCVHLLRITNNQSNTPTDFDQPTGGGNASRSVTIDAPAGGCIVVTAQGDENADPMAVTNASKLNEVAGANDTGTLAVYSTAAGNEANRVITVNPCRCVCAVAWA